MVVSHDRYFMDKIVDSLFVFRGDGIIENFPGNYSDFRAYENSQPPSSKVDKTTVEIPTKKNTQGKLSYNEKREYGALEKDIEKLQKKRKTIETMFIKGDILPEEINDKSLELQKIIEAIEEKEERWFELSMKLEE